MKHKIEFSGGSDDLVEVEGDVLEEFSFYTSDGNDEHAGTGYLAASDGSLATIRYVDGFWRIHLLHTGRGTLTTKRDGTNEDDDYSDRLTLERDTPFEWVIFARGKDNCARPSRRPRT